MDSFSFVIDRSVVPQRVNVAERGTVVRFECVSNYSVSVHELDQSEYANFVSRLGTASHSVLDACRQAVMRGDAALVRLCAERVARTVSSTY